MARLIIAASDADANLYYATRFLAPDPFVYLEADGRRILLMSDLELDRARCQARVDEVLYHSGRGAVRIEDIVLVERGGCRNLTRAPKDELLEL